MSEGELSRGKWTFPQLHIIRYIPPWLKKYMYLSVKRCRGSLPMNLKGLRARASFISEHTHTFAAAVSGFGDRDRPLLTHAARFTVTGFQSASAAAGLWANTWSDDVHCTSTCVAVRSTRIPRLTVGILPPLMPGVITSVGCTTQIYR